MSISKHELHKTINEDIETTDSDNSRLVSYIYCMRTYHTDNCNQE